MIEYNIETNHLLPLDVNKIIQWQKDYEQKITVNQMMRTYFNKNAGLDEKESLDILYGYK